MNTPLPVRVSNAEDAPVPVTSVDDAPAAGVQDVSLVDAPELKVPGFLALGALALIAIRSFRRKGLPL